MKKYFINKYYDLLIWLEDILAKPSDIVHKHRVKIDDKYWEKYLR